MERVIDPQVGEIFIYYGNKSIIRGHPIRCIGKKNNTSVYITGHNTETVWDTREWACKISFLSVYKEPEPDWEV